MSINVCQQTSNILGLLLLMLAQTISASTTITRRLLVRKLD